MKMQFGLCMIVYAFLSLFVVPSLSALPIIDGRFDTSEGYTTGYTIKLEVEKKNKHSGTVSADDGELWLTQDSVTGDLFLAFIQPLTLVDNSYGDDSIGWGSDAPSGKNHNYEDLTERDKAQFVFTDGAGNTVLDIVLDYAHVYNDNSVASSVTDGDGDVRAGSASDVKETATSLEYNYNIFGLSNPELFGNGSDSPSADQNYVVDDASLADWLFASVYELRVDGAVFEENGFGNAMIAVVHDSPNKIARNKVYPEIGDEIMPPNLVPEPSTIILLGIGLAGLGGGYLRMRIRKRK